MENKNNILLSPARIKATMVIGPITHVLLKNVNKNFARYLKPIQLLATGEEFLYQHKLTAWANGVPKNRMVPVLCKRLAYHLENFVEPTAINPVAQKNLKMLVSKLRGKAGFSYVQQDYENLIALEPVTIIVLETGEILAKYS